MTIFFGKRTRRGPIRRTLAQRVVDLLGRLFVTPSDRVRGARRVKNILVSRMGEVKDVFMTSSVLAHLRRAYPLANIDFLAGSAAVEVLRSNPVIDRILVHDPAAHNRTAGFFRKRLVSLTGFIRNVREMRRTAYDISIDLTTCQGNSILLQYLGRARLRVGFSTGGWGFLLNREVPCREAVHETARLKDALWAIGIEVREDALIPEFRVSNAASKECGRILNGLGITEDEPFVLVHTAAPSAGKMWKDERWKELVERIRLSYGIKVVAYRGPADKDLPGSAKLPPLISLEQFVAAAEKASLLIGLDTLATHIGASSGTPAITVWSGTEDHRLSCPIGECVSLVRKDVPCAPCFRPDGCAGMVCMDISTEDLMDEVSREFDFIKPARIFSNGFALYKFR